LSLILSPGLIEEMVRHARSVLPLESCGLLAGSDRMATRFLPITNRLASRTEFDMEPAELVAALRSFRNNGESLLAIFHSHPLGPAMPSARDVELSMYPEAVYVIASLASPESPEVRGFRIVDGKVVEVELHVIV